MTLRAVPAGISSPWQVQPCRISRGVEARQRTVPGPPGWGLGGGPITRPLKTKQITETLNVRRQPSLGANVIPCLDRQSMTPLGQSREDSWELNKSLMTPRTQIRIGNWNVRTMYTAGKSAQVARVMNQMKIQIMGISECRWIGAGRMKLSSGETLLYSGRDDDQHMQGVAIMMTPEATKALID